MLLDSRVVSRCCLVLVATLLLAAAALAHGPLRTGDPGERVIEFPDVAGRLTLVVDLHTHSVFSDGHVWPNVRVAEAIRDGLDAMAVTEHLEWQPHLEDIPHPDRNRSYQEALASLPEGAELIVIADSEITRSAPHGHMNAVFISDANTLFRVDAPPEPFTARDYFRVAGEHPAQSAIDEANRQGAFVFWNHSWSDFDDRRTVITDFHGDNAAAGKLHGIEVANGRTYSEESFRIALEHDLTLVGVSDVHNLIDWDYEPHNGGHRPVNLVFALEKSAESIRQALFEGRTAVWWKNLLIARERDMAPLLAASLTAESPGYDGDMRVLEVVLSNHSDAAFGLRNLTDWSLERSYDLILVPPHGETTLRLRTGEVLDEVVVELEVLNALIDPDTHPVVRFELPLG